LKAIEFADRILDGDLFQALDNDDINFAQSVVHLAAQAGALILCVHALCACARIVHYEVIKAELVTKADGSLHYELRTKCSLCIPQDDAPCSDRIVVPVQWAKLPMIHVRVNYTHEILDRAFQERFDALEARGR